MGAVCGTSAVQNAVGRRDGTGVDSNGIEVDFYSPPLHAHTEWKCKQENEQEQQQQRGVEEGGVEGERNQRREEPIKNDRGVTLPSSPPDCGDTSSVLFLSYLVDTETCTKKDVKFRHIIGGFDNATIAALTPVVTEATDNENNTPNENSNVNGNQNGTLGGGDGVHIPSKRVIPRNKNSLDVAIINAFDQRDHLPHDGFGSLTDTGRTLTRSMNCSDTLLASDGRIGGSMLRCLAEQNILDVVKRNFLERLPYHISPYVFRALALQTVTCMLPVSIITPELILECHVDIKGERPTSATPINLDVLRQKAPKILQYRILAFRENCIAKLMAAEKPTEAKSGLSKSLSTVAKEVKTKAVSGAESCKDSIVRAKVVATLLRSTASKAISFGAVLPQSVLRMSPIGPRLFSPKNSNVRGGGRSLPSITEDGTYSGSSSGVHNLFSTARECVTAAASFETMPSLFLKLGRSQRDTVQDHYEEAKRRRVHEVQPMFRREFLATLVFGCESLCRYATTMLPEVFVGLQTFLEKPRRAVASAVCVTLHRIYSTLAMEMLQFNAMMPVNDSRFIRAPSMDMSILYLREDSLYFASTPGMMGMLFLFTDTEQRIYAELGEAPVDITSHGPGNHSSRRGAPDESIETCGITSDSRRVAMGSRRRYELPEIISGMIDLSTIRGVVPCRPETETRPTGMIHTGCPLRIAQNICCGKSHLLNTQASLSNPTSLQFGGNGKAWSREKQTQKLCENTLPPPDEVPRVGVSLPHVVVTAATEFWDAMSPADVWELLRWMLLLDRDAANTTAHTRENNEISERRTMRYLSSLRLSTSVHPSVKRRLEHFHKKRVSHYISMDTLYSMTRQEIVEEKMRSRRVGEAFSPMVSPPTAPYARHLTTGDSLGDAIATVLATAVYERWPLWTNPAEERKFTGSSCAVMVVVVPEAVAATIK